MENITKIEWMQDHKGMTGRIITIRDAYQTYYAELPESITTEEAVEHFIETYDYNDTGTERALRAELRVYDYTTAVEID